MTINKINLRKNHLIIFDSDLKLISLEGQKIIYQDIKNYFNDIYKYTSFNLIEDNKTIELILVINFSTKKRNK